MHMCHMSWLCVMQHNYQWQQNKHNHHDDSHSSPLRNAIKVNRIVLNFFLDVLNLINLNPGQAPINS